MARHDTTFDAVVVGAGFAGLYMLHRLRGLGLSATVLEAAADVGGTWYWNRYPGARCDVESMQYSYSFCDDLQQDWRWSERYAGQPEILRYAGHVADRFDLRRDIRFDTTVVAATFDDGAGLWRLDTGAGDAVTARFCVMATGCLSSGRKPGIPGMDAFAGPSYHTGEWPHEGVDLSGQRVAVIGTGSSAIQCIPVIAEQAAQLLVMQRTPNFSVPARNQPMTPEYEDAWKRDYPARREYARSLARGIIYEFGAGSAKDTPAEVRQREYESRWRSGGIGILAAYTDLNRDAESNHTAAEFVRGQIRAIVQDPATAGQLLPDDHHIGTKRICMDTGYYETFNRPNVTLVNLRREPIEAVTRAGIRTAAREYEVDAIVYATGFDAMTGTLLRMDIRGAGGLPLRDAWAEGPRSYLGLMVAGFPNLFTVTGPGSPSVLSNMMLSIEQHVDWIADCLGHMATHGLHRIEAEPAAQEDWVAHGAEVAEATLYPRAASWYMGANIPGKPRVFMPYVGGVGVYREKCGAIAAAGYTGFRLDPPAAEGRAAE